MHRERVFDGPRQLVPRLRMRRRVDRLGDELVPRVGKDAALGRNRAGQRVEQEQTARHLPAAEVARRRRPPHVRRQPRARAGDDRGDLAQHPLVDARLRRGILEGVIRVQLAQPRLECLEARLAARRLLVEVLFPVPPAAHEVAVVGAGLDHLVGDGEQDRGLAAGPRREPVIGVGRRIRQPHVEHDDLGAGVLALDDALGVRVEVVTGLQVRADQEDDVGVGVVGARPVESHPKRVADASARRADVGVRIVAVDAPCGQHPLGVAVLAGPADVVHHRVVAILDDRLADARRDVVERLVPRRAHPPALAALARALERE